MIATFHTCILIFPAVFLGEYPLPAEIGSCVRILFIESTGQRCFSPACCKICFMNLFYLQNMIPEWFDKYLRQHGTTVLGAFSISYQYFIQVKIDILYSEI